MKRSYMEDMIREYLDILASGEVNHNTKESAEYILGCCETFGMLPPTIYLELFKRNDNVWEKE